MNVQPCDEIGLPSHMAHSKVSLRIGDYHRAVFPRGFMICSGLYGLLLELMFYDLVSVTYGPLLELMTYGLF